MADSRFDYEPAPPTPPAYEPSPPAEPPAPAEPPPFDYEPPPPTPPPYEPPPATVPIVPTVGAVPEPSPAPPVAPPGEILSVGKTSDSDKFVVKSALESGGFRQTVMSAAEVRDAGGLIPTGRIQQVQKYAGTSLYGGPDKKPSAAYAAVEYLKTEEDQTDSSARLLVEGWVREPDHPKWDTVSVASTTKLFDLLQPKGYQLLPYGDTVKVVSNEAYRKLFKLDPKTEEFWDALISLRLIPKGTPWVDPVIRKKAVIAMEKYAIKDDKEDKDKITGYELIDAVGDKSIPAVYLTTLFGANAVKEAKDWIVDQKAQTVALRTWLSGATAIGASPTTGEVLFRGKDNKQRWVKLDGDAAKAYALVIHGQEQGKSLDDLIMEGASPKLLKLVYSNKDVDEAVANVADMKKYADWTSDELLHGRVTPEGQFIPVPWGVKGTTYTSPPNWVKAKLQKQAVVQLAALQKTHVQLPDGNWIAEDSLEEIKQQSPEDYDLVMSKGFTAYRDKFESGNVEGFDGTWMPKSDYDALTADQQKIFKEEGYQPLVESFPKDIGMLTAIGHEMTPWKEEEGEGVTVGGGATMAAEILVPYVYLFNRRDELSPAEKIAIGAIDTLSLIPIFYFQTRAISGMARAGVPLTRALGRASLMELKAPFIMVAHPLETVKAPFRLAAELLGPRRVPPEVVIGSIASPAAKEGMSDLRMAVGAGKEEAGATLQAHAELQRSVIMNTDTRTLQGLQLVQTTPTGLQKITGPGSVVHAGPGFENFIDELIDTGRIVVKGKEGGLYSAATGSLFWKGSATGGGGQIPFEAIIDTMGVAGLPRATAGIKDVKVLEQATKKILNKPASIIYFDNAMESFKIYHRTAEGEVLIRNMSSIVAVPGPTKTFKWTEPVKELTERSLKIRQAAALKLEEIAELLKKLPNMTEAERATAISRMELLKKECDDVAKIAKQLDKEAIKQGIKRSRIMNMDFLEMVDPMSGQKILVPHLALEGVDAKPWTAVQRLKLKKKGYINIPRDIFQPGLKNIKTTDIELLGLVAQRTRGDETSRLVLGKLLSDTLGGVKSPVTGLKVDLGKVDVLKDVPPKLISQLEDIFKGLGKDARLGGSLVEQTFTGKTIAGDLDAAVEISKMKEAADAIAAAFRDNGYTVRLRSINAEMGLGGAGYGVDYKVGGKWVKAIDLRDYAVHRKKLAYGMPTMESVNIGGIHIESPAEMLQRRLAVMLFPGFGPEDTFRIGPEAAGKISRMKDIPRTKILADHLIDTYESSVGRMSPVTGKPGDYKYGQRLVDALSDAYGLPSVPVDKMAYWKSIQRGHPEGLYLPATKKIALPFYSRAKGQRGASTALHELVHPIVQKAVPNVPMGRVPAGHPLEFLASTLRGHPNAQALWRIAQHQLQELVTIEYVRRISGYANTGYSMRILQRLDATGRILKSPMLSNYIDLAAIKAVDKMNPTRILDLNEAWKLFKITKGAGTKLTPDQLSASKEHVRTLRKMLAVLMKDQIPTELTPKIREALVAMGVSDEVAAVSIRPSTFGKPITRKLTPEEALTIIGRDKAEKLGIVVGKDIDALNAKFIQAVDDLRHMNDVRYLEDKLRLPRNLRTTSPRVKMPYAEVSRAALMAYPSLARLAERGIRLDIGPRMSAPELARRITKLSRVSEYSGRISAVPRIPTTPRVTTPSRIPTAVRAGEDSRLPTEIRITRVPPPGRRVPPTKRIPPPGGRIPPPGGRIPPPGGRIPPTKRVPPPTKPIITPPSGAGKGRPGVIPEGSIAWKQGEMMRGRTKVPVWKYIPPPWTMDKPLTMYESPIGAVRTGLRTPEETVQMIGHSRAQVPKEASIDLGIADILVSEHGRRIQFTGKGLETNVSGTLTTGKGMTITGGISRYGFADEPSVTRRRSKIVVRGRTKKSKVPKWRSGESFSLGEITGL